MAHISVAIPAYNRAHLLGRTIESVLCQTHADFDLTVVDDTSKDNTAEVARQYCDDPRVRVLVNEHNLGLTRNWNRCLDLATGPLVQVMQSDDLIDAEYLQRVDEVIAQHPDVGFVAASCRYIDAEDRVIHPGTPRPPQLYPAGDEAVTALVAGGYPHASSIVVRRECYDRLGGFDERIWHGPDMEMDARLASRYGYYHLGQVCTSFRRHGANMGVLNYLRKDYITTDLYKRRLTLGYLSEPARRRLGIDDLDRYLARVGAQSALIGATDMVAYGRGDLARHYLREALHLDRQVWRRSRFWTALGLALVPALGARVMRKRMQVTRADEATAGTVAHLLADVGAPRGTSS